MVQLHHSLSTSQQCNSQQPHLGLGPVRPAMRALNAQLVAQLIHRAFELQTIIALQPTGPLGVSPQLAEL